MTRPATGWMEAASCLTLEQSEAHQMFFGHAELSLGAVRAMAMCQACPVLEECRAYFDELEPDARDRLFGVVAGEFPAARLARRRAARGAVA